MGTSENATTSPVRKTSSNLVLRDWLMEVPAKFYQEIDGKRTIVFDGFIFEGEIIVLDHFIKVTYPLLFRSCSFNSLSFNGLKCNDSLVIEKCTFQKQIIFVNGSFDGEVVLKNLQTKSIHFIGCTFDKISILGNDLEQVLVSNAKFKHLQLGGHSRCDVVRNFTLFAKEEETGDVEVNQLILDDIYLTGNNKGSIFNFNKIKCSTVRLTKFQNEGSLSFYSLETKEAVKNQGYFQVDDSNLKQAQFFRVFFSDFKELIIVDSFLTECLFVGCNWGANVRALKRGDFDSAESGKSVSSKSTNDENLAIKEAYRQLKICMAKQSDKIQELKFYAEELNSHNKTITWTLPWKNQFWDKLILTWSKYFSDYGQSFIKPLFWLLIGHFVLFVAAIKFGAFASLEISFIGATKAGFKEAYEKFFVYINPLRKMETNLTGYLAPLDILMRVWCSYMLYNLIRASRRFIA